jgi:CBS domain-containing protein
VPRTLGVGYDNISDIISGTIVGRALVVLFVMKLVSWSVALGSGTSGGTLAPLFTIGGGLGAALGEVTARLWPQAGIDPRIAALVGMAALFAGASRALLTSVVFAFETTLQPVGLLPLLGGCSAAYVVSALMMRHTIMTEKLARRGVRVPAEYTADFLEQVPVSEVASSPVITLCAEDSLEIVRTWLDSGAPEAHHQGFPVIDEQDQVLGVVTRRDLLDRALPDEMLVSDAIKRRPIVIHEDHSVRQAADHMARENVGRLLVLSNTTPPRMVGIITRGDLLAAHARRLRESHDATRGIRVMDAMGAGRRAS